MTRARRETWSRGIRGGFVDGVCGPDVPSQRTAERALRAIVPGLTPRQRELGASRWRLVLGWQAWRLALKASAGNGTQTAPSGRWRVDRSVDAFLAGLPPPRPAPSTFFRWLRAVDTLGPAGLVDRRGQWSRTPAPIDWRLWSRFVAGLAGGCSMRSLDRALRPLAERERRVWPSLGTLMRRTAPIRRLMRRNRRVFAALATRRAGGKGPAGCPQSAGRKGGAPRGGGGVANQTTRGRPEGNSAHGQKRRIPPAGRGGRVGQKRLQAVASKAGADELRTRPLQTASAQ
jgi:hypothetical protein